MKRLISFFMALIMLCTTFPLAASAKGAGKNSATNIALGTTYESRLAVEETEWYKIVPQETQYYRFHVRNQSIEWRTGIGLVDWFGNLWNSYIDVLVYDSRDDKLGKMSVRCGYEGQLAIKLEKGKTYYITVKSGHAEGNYWLSATKLNDVGGDTWQAAIDTLSNGQIVSAVDTSSDKDWFCFNADQERAYYTFSLENIGGDGSIYLDLYQYVAGAGEFPMREVQSLSVYSNRKDSICVQLEEGSKYYYRISGAKSGYVLDVTMQLDAAGASRSEAYSVNVGSEYVSSFDGTGDIDYYKFETSSSPAYYHFDIENLTGNYYYAWVYDSMGNVIVSSSSYRNINLDSKLKTNSTYYLALKGTIANYTFSVTEKKDTYADEREKASQISVNKEYSTSFDGTKDKDYVKFTTCNTGAYYHFDLSNLSDKWFNVWVEDADGNDVVSKECYSGSMNVKLEPNSTYYILFKGSNSNYKFKVTQKNDSEADTKESAKTVKLNSIKDGGLQSDDDADWFKLVVSSGGNYRLRLVNYGKSSSYFADLYDSRDSSKCYISTYGDSNSVVYLEPGTYYIKITGYAEGYYSFVLASCGDAHKKTYTYSAKSTMTNDGQKRVTCSKCGVFIENTKVAKIESVALSKTAYTYDGKAKAPAVTVKDSEGKTLKKDTDYTVKYETGRKNPGKYTVTVTFKGKYSGTKKLYFTIAPKVTSKITASQTTSTITLKWNKVTGADGYRVYQYNSKSKKWVSVKTITATSLKISKLKAGTVYKFRVRAYKKDGSTIWGSYSKTFETATKTATPKITKLTTTKGKVNLNWSNVAGESGYQIYYATKKDGEYKKLGSYKANVVSASKSKLTSKKTYYFKVRAYKKTAGGTVYSAWSAVKSIKIK